MITKDDREEIVNEVVERIYLRLPEIIGNLISNHAMKLRLNKEFYDKYPDLKDHRNIVAAIVERIEADDPTKPIADIMKAAAPEVRRQLKNLTNLDMKSVNKPKLDFGPGEI